MGNKTLRSYDFSFFKLWWSNASGQKYHCFNFNSMLCKKVNASFEDKLWVRTCWYLHGWDETHVDADADLIYCTEDHPSFILCLPTERKYFSKGPACVVSLKAHPAIPQVDLNQIAYSNSKNKPLECEQKYSTWLLRILYAITIFVIIAVLGQNELSLRQYERKMRKSSVEKPLAGLLKGLIFFIMLL